MATAIEPLVIDPQSRFLEMKSLQPYSTKDEYLYAMKEDLADWLSNMYPDWCPITADNFVECLENGALLCHHANNVNDAARKVVPSLSSLTNCKYRVDARPGTFNARDNVSQFIKWARSIAGVREVLMFESDDLILRKNEKNFILCLLEIARFGAKFGMSVPNIIKLEQEIEREIERDKEIEKILTDSQHSERREREDYENQFDSNEYQTIQTNQYDSNEYQQIQTNQYDSTNYQLIRDDENEIDSNNYQVDQNNENEIDSNNYHLVDSNENQVDLHTANWLQQQQQQHLAKMSNNNNSKHRHGSEESYDSTTSSDLTTAVVNSNEEQQFSRPLVIKHKPMVAPASSSHLHKTVVNIVNSCNCSHRFPVIRIGEGKYRIGENGTIIFIRILRNHVMVRVGGGWDTLENYLNKHDPCREKGHRRNQQDNHHHHHHHPNHSDIPILAIPNTNISPSVQKNTPYGKSVTIKTEEFPLAKPSNHDTNLVDAQLVITRGADGRHRIGQITYKAEEDVLNQQPTCPQHQHTSTSPSKMKSARSTGNLALTSVFTKQSSPSTDQDYSSLAETTNDSKPSSSSSLDLKEDSIEQPIKSLDLITNTPLNRPIQRYSSTNKSRTQPLVQDIDHSFESSSKQIIPNNKSSGGITESIIGNIDGNIYPTSVAVEHDFDINDIQDVLGISDKQNSDDKAINMDNDSLENSEGAIEEKKKKPVLPPSSTRKLSGATPVSHISQRQKFQQEQTTSRRRPPTSLNRYALRSGTLPNVPDAVKKEEQINKQRRKPMVVSHRSQSSEVIEKLQDISKLDRDSGFDEQDFRRERLLSNGDDSSSISSIKSARSSTIHSINYEIRENKAYELRMKKLDAKRTSLESNSPSKTTRSIDSSSSSSRRGSELVPPPPPTTTTPSRYRKNSQPNINIKQQQQTSPNKKTNS